MKVVSITDEGITFDDGTEVTDYHGQDCCEDVYADWSTLEDSGIMDEISANVEIEGVKDSGIRINKHFVPCYNKQNGYYSSALEIRIAHPDGRVDEIDISEFVKDDIH